VRLKRVYVTNNNRRHNTFSTQAVGKKKLRQIYQN